MLEAVNSVLQTAPLARAATEQVSTVDSFAANPERVQRSAPQAPYISPYIYLDVNYDKAVILLRNGDTGDVEGQFPSEAALEQQARQLAKLQVAAQTPEPAPQHQTQSAQPSVQQQHTAPAPAPDTGGETAAISIQQQAAFAAAARSGNSNAGNVTLFA